VFHALRSRDFRLLRSGQTVIGPSATRWAAGFFGLYSPSQIRVAGFGLAAVLWLARLSIERVRNAA
jgi:hypothetical protein